MVRAVFLLLLFSLSLTPSARAQTTCASLPHPVIGVGGSASKPLIARVAAHLAGSTSPLTVIYQSPGACFGISHYADNSTITGNASYWTTDGVEHTCTLPTVTGVHPQFGMLGTNALLCSGITALPTGIGEFDGPVTSWSFIVPTASSQTTISAEALYFIYGFGASAGGVTPWTIDSEIFGRNATSAAAIATSLLINVPVSRLINIDTSNNQGTVNAVSGATTPESAIGYVSTETTEAGTNPTLVRTLAYQHYGQSCGYWPGSTSTSFDRRNVRDGHYVPWSQYYFYAPVDSAGQIIDADTRTFVGYFTGDVTPPADVPILDDEIHNGNVPECAMRVWRDTDFGPLYSFVPPFSCTCHFELVATGAAPASCTACTTDAQCTSGSATHCRFGYCEVS